MLLGLFLFAVNWADGRKVWKRSEGGARLCSCSERGQVPALGQAIRANPGQTQPGRTDGPGALLSKQPLSSLGLGVTRVLGPSHAVFHPPSVCWVGGGALCCQGAGPSGLRGPFQLKLLSDPARIRLGRSFVRAQLPCPKQQASRAAAATFCCHSCCKTPGSFQPLSLVKAESGGTWMMLTIQSVFQAVKCLLILFVLVCKSGCNYDTEHIHYPVGERCKVWLNVMN